MCHFEHPLPSEEQVCPSGVIRVGLTLVEALEGGLLAFAAFVGCMPFHESAVKEFEHIREGHRRL